MVRAACTIVSLNYLPYARTLCESFLQFHPDLNFYVLLVDRLPEDLDLTGENFRLILVEDLGIPNFRSVSFKYDILELNTNVKPTFLRMILNLGVDELIYFDPDILIYSPLDVVYSALATAAIILTPHSTSPNYEDPNAELASLVAGEFNLGFIALSRCEVSLKFLGWWETRCLNLAFSEHRTGLFVDQKWINLVPCFFESTLLLKNPGCNAAYWNLYERMIHKDTDQWLVNQDRPLIFYHFSGVDVDGGDRISKYIDRFDLSNRPEMRELFADYRNRLEKNGIREFRNKLYSYGYFSNNQFINRLARRAYAANLDRFSSEDPFNCNGNFYHWAFRKGLLTDNDTYNKYTEKSYRKNHAGIWLINTLFRVCLFLIGADRYTLLMRYISYLSILRNQRDVFGE